MQQQTKKGHENINKARPIAKGAINTKVPVPDICNYVTKVLICDLNRALTKVVALAWK